MLTILRKIRRTLIDSGAARKYVLYAIGEILLVMIGILLALQVNNWNEQRTLQKKVDTQLLNLSLSLEENLRMLHFHQDANERRFYTWQHILKYAGKDTVVLVLDSWNEEKDNWSGPIPSNKNDDFINAGLVDISWAFLPPPWHSEAINEMKGIGLFSEIENEVLKGDINRFYFLLELYMGTPEMDAYHLSRELTDLLRNQKNISVFGSTQADKILEDVADDPQIEVMLIDLIHHAHEHYYYVVKLIDKADKLVTDISLEILK